MSEDKIINKIKEQTSAVLAALEASKSGNFTRAEMAAVHLCGLLTGVHLTIEEYEHKLDILKEFKRNGNRQAKVHS